MLARFIEQGGDRTTAASIRANWSPAWGADPGGLTGTLPTPGDDPPMVLPTECAMHIRKLSIRGLRTEPASPEPAWKRMGHDNSERCTTCGANWRNMPVTPCVSLSRQVKDDAASLNSDGAKERIPSQRPETPEVGAYARGVRDALETAALVVDLEGAEGTKSLAKSLRAMVTGSEGT